MAAGLTGLYATFIPQAGIWCTNMTHGPRNSNRVALTFDDGPSAGHTDRVLEILAAHRVPAAFFVIGQNVEQDPALLRRLHEAGHVIGNHTWSHDHLSVFRGPAYWRDQLIRTDELVARHIGKRPCFFRPPVGIKFIFTARAVRRTSSTMVTWSRRGRDGVNTAAEQILDRLCPRTRGGDIIALHDGIDPHSPRKTESTMKALPELISRLRDRGLEFARLDDLLGIPAYHV